MSRKHNYVRHSGWHLEQQLIQLLTITADEHLLSSDDRDELEELSYVVRADGFNIITADGISKLVMMERLKL